MNDPTSHAGTLRLTAHPLQRAGAYAMAELAGHDAGPETLPPDGFARAVDVMTTDLLNTAPLTNAKGPGAFWLAASYMLWPNSPMNGSGRGRQTPDQRRAAITAWRTYPTELMSPEVPCSLCGTPACGWFGKVDIPLGASIKWRNTTAPGHEGQPLCVGCLASLHAAPYGCALFGRAASVLHSWDEDWMRHAVKRQVKRTREHAAHAKDFTANGMPARRSTALRDIRDYPGPAAQLELIMWSNSNRDPFMRTHEMRESVMEWVMGLDSAEILGLGETEFDVLASLVFSESFNADFGESGSDLPEPLACQGGPTL